GLAQGEVDAVAGFMLERRGHSYDLKNILDLARYLIRQPPVPDTFKRRMLALGSGQQTRAICSTVLAQAFGSIGYPILPGIDVLEGHGSDGRFMPREVLHIRRHSPYS